MRTLMYLVRHGATEANLAKPGMPCPNVGDALGDNLRGAAEKEHPIPLLLSPARQLWNQVGSGDAFRQPVSQPAGDPEQRGAVAKHKISLKENAPQLDITLGLGEEVQIGRDHLMGPA